VKYPDYGKNADDLIQAADVAMSRAKQSGRNSFEHFDAHSQVEVVNRLELEYDLKQALSNQEILCFFQPVVYADGKIHAMEVLIRWQHPILGMLKPKDFLELAENTGIISELSYQVFVMAFRQLHQWQEQKLCQLDFKLSFNLSSRQFFRKSIIEDILRLKKEQHVNVKNMILEFTESTLTRDSDGISSVLNELKSMGIELALDSYGSGYSSLHLLASLPLDYLKIDQSFVKEIKFVNQSIIETTLKFANSMSMKVVAVGVETDQQFSNLAASGIDFLQGDFISAATGSEETTNRLKKQLGNLPLKPVNSISNIK
jgi:EAL domain-containing protein (putative c-di-GMP-specific phosphodiesterase class I)